jgi:hypothetical protein
MYVSSESEIRSTTECLVGGRQVNWLLQRDQVADGGKEFRNWSHLEKSKRLIEYYVSRGSDLVGGSDFYEVKGDNKDELVANNVRKELILDIASWVSATSVIESSSTFTSPILKRSMNYS